MKRPEKKETSLNKGGSQSFYTGSYEEGYNQCHDEFEKWLPSKKILVCDNCLTEACIKGDIFCKKHRIAGTVELTKKQLIKVRTKRIKGK